MFASATRMWAPFAPPDSVAFNGPNRVHVAGLCARMERRVVAVEPPPNDDVDARLADLRRRRVEAVDVLSEALLDLFLKRRRDDRTCRRVPPRSPPPPPIPPRPKPPPPKPVRLRPPAAIRKYRNVVESDLDLVAPLLEPMGLTRQELDEPVNREFVVQQVQGVITGVGIIDKHGPLGVLRAAFILPKVRRLRHGSYLVIQLLKRAHRDRLLSVYANGVVPRFLSDVGFEVVDRASLPELVLSLPGISGTTEPLFEIHPRPDGAKRPWHRHYPKTLTELLAASARTIEDVE